MQERKLEVPKQLHLERVDARLIVERLEDVEDLLGEVSIEDNTRKLPKAAKTVELGSLGGKKQDGQKNARTS